MKSYRGVGPRGRRRAGGGGGAPGRTAIQRNPGGSFADWPGGRAAPLVEPGLLQPEGAADAAAVSGGSSLPWHRGHHARCLSRTFHRVLHEEQTWITGPA